MELLHHLNQPLFKGYKNELDIPKGTYRNLDKYYSIQKEFPRVYHVGEEGVPTTASNQERAQIKQLKAYLTIFDQIMIDYLTQLGQVRNLLSVDQSGNGSTNFSTPLTQDHIPFLDDLKLFKDVELYRKKLLEITESPTDRRKKKRAILNHLIARFGEYFDDQIVQVFKSKSVVKPSREQSKDWSLACKADFLKCIPEISRERGCAFNYTGKPDYWNSENVAGVKKRVSKLLCLPDFQRKTLTCKPQYEVIKIKDIPNNCYEYAVIPKGNPNEILLRGLNVFPLLMNEDSERMEIMEAIRGAGRFEVVEEGIFFKLLLKNQHGKVIAHSESLEEDAIELLKLRIHNLAFPNDCQSLGFHVLEHILLRPKNNAEKFLDPFEYFKGCPTKDPYSFWITVILPSWLEVFEDYTNRHLFEQVFLKETPAHIVVRFCYLNPNEMQDFEHAYLNWLHDMAKEDQDPRDLQESKNALITVVNSLECCKEDTRGNEIIQCKLEI